MTKLSRSKVELFVDCPCCFWLDVKKGIKRPPPAPYTINSAIDVLLKREFDLHRAEGTAHALMRRYHIEAVPYRCDQLNNWRNNFVGVQFPHQKSGFLVFGAIDDVWRNAQNELIVVDYKATGANSYKIYGSYKRQMEIYQWLLIQNSFSVSSIGYFLFAKVNKERGFGQGQLSFDLSLEPLQGDTSWIDEVLLQAREVLMGQMPVPNQACIYCQYAQARGVSGPEGH
ncbi:MAG: PD-(D/E)XK nuclease family protein [Candidatus Omnitrophica bacterium]|nr:PD-(D/E)XK nuclease family protein [Candidatus Omnitrophota bacterium]